MPLPHLKVWNNLLSLLPIVLVLSGSRVGNCCGLDRYLQKAMCGGLVPNYSTVGKCVISERQHLVKEVRSWGTCPSPLLCFLATVG